MRSNSARFNPVTYCASRLRQWDISTLNFGAMILTAYDPKQPVSIRSFYFIIYPKAVIQRPYFDSYLHNFNND